MQSGIRAFCTTSYLKCLLREPPDALRVAPLDAGGYRHVQHAVRALLELMDVCLTSTARRGTQRQQVELRSRGGMGRMWILDKGGAQAGDEAPLDTWLQVFTATLSP